MDSSRFLKFHLGQLKDPNVLETFQAMTGGKFAPLTNMNNEDIDLDSFITTFNTAMTETASEILGKHRLKKKKKKRKKKNPGSLQKLNSWSVQQKERTEKETIWT